MEKIIAVVVMIAIVIGLIATAVMPMVSQMNEQGNQANSQLGMLTATMNGDQISGATLKAEVRTNFSKFKLAAPDTLTSITIVASTTKAFGPTDTLTTVESWMKANVSDDAIFTKAETYKAGNGKLDTVTYTLVK